jgi:hypothetical protein
MAEIVYGKGGPNINYQSLACDVDLQPLFIKRIMGVYATREEYSINTIKKCEGVENMYQTEIRN